MTRTQESIQPEGKEDRGRGNFQRAMRQTNPGYENHGYNDPNGKRVPQCNGW